MRALVTGGAGFIGSHLVDRLIADDHEVTVIDDLSTGKRENVGAAATFYESDIASFEPGDEDLLWREIKATDLVFHLAAAVGVKLVVDEPVRTLITNLRGTENVLTACSGFGKRVVIASSSEVYGSQPTAMPLAEDQPRLYGPTTERRWAYAESKAIDEFLALAYRDEHLLDVRIARLFNTVGPRQTGRYGMVLPRFAERAVAGREIEVYGSGEQTRSFCHVSDIVEGLIRLAGLATPGAATRTIYNLGNPHNHISINALAEMVRNVAGRGVRIVHVPHEITDPLHRRPDIARAYADLDWVPTVPLRVILEIAVRTAREEHEMEVAR